jgi:membrane protease YdiL (CAAX protease family)
LQDAENQPVKTVPPEDSGQELRLERDLLERNPLLFNELGLRAGWRVLIWVVICFAFGFLLLTFFAAFQRQIPLGIAGVAAILGANALMAKLENRSSLSYGFADRKWPSHFCFGVLIGWISLTLMLTGLRAADHFSFGPQYMHGSTLAVSAFLNAISFLFGVALFEEILFRGYALYTLADGMGFWPAAIVLSLGFAAAHRGNGGETSVGLVAVVFFGLVLCFSIWRTGSLLLAVGFHFMWDYSESFLYGVPDSGFVSPQHLLSAKFSGPAWITGGTVGPEGSWFIFLVLSLIAVVIHFSYPSRQFQTRNRQSAIAVRP